MRNPQGADSRQTRRQVAENGRSALLIAYHFPPVKVSSGVQRTLKNVQYLSDFGWECSVLSAHPRAYESTSQEQMGEIPSAVEVVRAQAWDTKRHLGLLGRYPAFLALPDRWASWLVGGVLQGLALVRRRRPALIWSTYPIATAHLIGFYLHRLTGIPWIADFRDSMTEEGYPRDARQWRSFRRLEAQVARHCARAVFTAPSAWRMYRDRYPDSPGIANGVVIPNGYDEANFEAAGRVADTVATGSGPPVTLVHSGVLYPEERDPSAFFEALADLKQRGVVEAGRLRVVLRATGHDGLYAEMIERLAIADLVDLAPPLPYEQALAEMLLADGLLLFQSASCNHQIPAKLYEYFRAQRPVLALTDSRGDTASTLREAGIDTIAPLDNAAAIASALTGFLEGVGTGRLPVADATAAASYSRRALAGRLAAVFDEVAGVTTPSHAANPTGND